MGQPSLEWQPLSEHLEAVGRRAAEYGVPLGIEKSAGLAGRLHDLGKGSRSFQDYLNGTPIQVDHSTAGARYALSAASSPSDRIASELIAYAIAGHHAGLPDRIGGDGSLNARLRKQIDDLAPEWLSQVDSAIEGLLPDFKWIKDPTRVAFQLAFLGRMIFSCLVDADFRDTEAFFARHKGIAKDRKWDALPLIVDDLIHHFDAYMAGKQAGNGNSRINLLRREILEHVRAKASGPTGLYSLTVPTGGGKTLDTLGFALEHAKRHNLRRIIYAIPFTSVIDQTAQVFRDVLGSEHVLEHHSAIDSDFSEWQSNISKWRLATEDWAAPIIVTTNVQLFESLFSDRSSRCRKLHNLARSVIILDEAQTIPLPLLRPCVAAIDELARNYGTSVVVCTATQPALAAPDFVNGFEMGPEQELAPDPAELGRLLKRVNIIRGGQMDDDDLVAALNGQSQGLIIVNSRKHALSLYRSAKSAGLDGVIHLTTRQYAAHRRLVLQDVRERLKKNLPCRLIATSLVEAGVDIDFPRVWRAEAGLDQIAQAAGRCNREGRRDPAESIVTIFEAAHNPPPLEIQQLAGDFARVAGKHSDLLSPDAIRDYFGEVYWRNGQALDAKKILEDFRLNGGETNFAYRTAAQKFRMIESGFVPVIVARDPSAQDTLSRLRAGRISPVGAARKLQVFIVQVPPKARDILLAKGYVKFLHEEELGEQFAVLRMENLYLDDIGLLWEKPDHQAQENSVF